MPEFKDFDEYRAWLTEQRREVVVGVAARSALRMAPLLFHDTEATNVGLALVGLRAILISGVAAVGPTPEISSAANAAADAALSALNAAAKTNAANANAALSALSADASLVGDDVTALMIQPLWPDDLTFDEVNQDSIRKAAAASPVWRFWARWYDGFLTGAPLDWALQENIALIPDDEWRRASDETWGDVAGRIAGIIEGIEVRFRTNVAPRLLRGGDGRYDVEADIMVADEPFGFAVGQVRIALDAALRSGTANGFTRDASEADMILDALKLDRSSGSVVAATFFQACMSLERRLGDEYPEDPPLIGLKNTLYVSVDELCAQDDLIRDRIGRLAALEVRARPSDEDRAELATAPDAVSDELTERAGEELREAVGIVVEAEKPPRYQLAKVVNWLSTIGAGLDRAQKNERRALWLLKLAAKFARLFGLGSDGSED